jgi:hypothetical protein
MDRLGFSFHSTTPTHHWRTDRKLKQKTNSSLYES